MRKTDEDEAEMIPVPTGGSDLCETSGNNFKINLMEEQIRIRNK